MTKAKLYIIFGIVLLAFSTASGQLIENNNSGAKADKKIKKETGFYQHPASDKYWPDSLCLMWIKEFDTEGRLIKFTDHWQCGQVYCIYEYEYGEDGQCRKSWISYQSNNFRRTEMIHKFDDKGHLVARWPNEPIPKFPLKETFEYNEKGDINSYKQWRKGEKGLFVDYTKVWEGKTDYDTRPQYKVYNKQSALLWTVKRKFEYYKK